MQKHAEERNDEIGYCLEQALIFKRSGRITQANALLNIALKIDPFCVPALRGYAMNLIRENDFPAALSYQSRLLEIHPLDPVAVHNRGVIRFQLHQFALAMEDFRAALQLKPDYTKAAVNLGITLLLLGRYDEGFPFCEARLRSTNKTPGRQNPLSSRLWTGHEDLNGKTILLQAEQGQGDFIQFSRFASRLCDLGATVTLEAPPSLCELMHSLPSCVQVVQAGKTQSHYDFHCSTMSLPSHLGVQSKDIPFANGYLSAEPAAHSAWAIELDEARTPKVGVVWSGSSRHLNDSKRSCSLESLLPYLPPGLSYYSLQTDIRAHDQATLDASNRLVSLGPYFKNYADTARACMSLDLVITVDTSIAHLCGALGKPVWVVLPYTPDWRWMLDRADSPWYSSMKLLRQDSSCSWHSLFATLPVALNRHFSLP